MELRIPVFAHEALPFDISARLRLKRDARLLSLDGAVAAGSLRFAVQDDDQLLSLVVGASGYWTVRQDLSSGAPPSPVVLEALSAGGPRRWWHEVMGVTSPDPGAGSGIRIGIVDTGFPPGPGLEHLRLLDPDGRPLRPSPIPLLTHGEMVARLIGQRPGGPGQFCGLAPDAEIVAIDVSHPAGGFDPIHVANAIVSLAVDHGCHLINFSGGRDAEKPGLLASVRRARAAGALCIVAAGNEDRDAVAFPARYPECVAVGSIGRRGWGPTGSQIRYFSDMTPEHDGRLGRIDEIDVFHFALSCYGEGLDVVAPGVGLIVCRGDVPVSHATGTSFAAPLVTGALARVLARDADYLASGATRERADHAQDMVRRMAQSCGIDPEREGMGVPRCHAGVPRSPLQ